MRGRMERPLVPVLCSPPCLIVVTVHTLSSPPLRSFGPEILVETVILIDGRLGPVQ